MVDDREDGMVACAACGQEVRRVLAVEYGGECYCQPGCVRERGESESESESETGSGSGSESEMEAVTSRGGVRRGNRRLGVRPGDVVAEFPEGHDNPDTSNRVLGYRRRGGSQCDVAIRLHQPLSGDRESGDFDICTEQAVHVETLHPEHEAARYYLTVYTPREPPMNEDFAWVAARLAEDGDPFELVVSRSGHGRNREQRYKTAWVDSFDADTFDGDLVWVWEIDAELSADSGTHSPR